MTVTSVIKKVAVKRLSEYGFKYEGKEGSVVWMFSKEKGEATQYIMFQKSNYFKGIRLEMYTSVPQTGLGSGFYASHFVEKRRKIGNDFWEYSDNLSLENAINEQLDIDIKYGMEALDTLCTPIVNPTEEMERALTVDTYEKAVRFSEKYNLSFSDIENSISKLQDIIESMNSIKLEECEKDLIDAAAYLGKLIKKFHGGEWYWDEELKMLTLGNIDNVNWEDSFLYWITNFWGNPKFIFYTLVTRYRHLLIQLDALKQDNMQY